MKKFSFIIPVYNCASYLMDCVKNIQAMGLEQYEIILVNDGSSDNSDEICQELLKHNSTIKYVYQENQGVSSARNKGLLMAEGEYIVFVDADDTIDSDKMADMLNVVQENDTIDLFIFGISFDYYYHKKCYRQEKLFYPKEGCMSKKEWLGDFEKLYEVNALSPIWNKVFRRDILINHNLAFNTGMFIYEDLEFSIRYLAYCDTIYNTSECIYHYRQSEDEGNAGRRLNRIEHLSDLVSQIEMALDELIEVQCMQEQTWKIKNILLDLYCVLSREKIEVSSAKEIKSICYDFSLWYKARQFVTADKNVKWVGRLLNCSICYFVFRRIYISYRHKLAVWLKNTTWYQRKRINTNFK